MPEFKVKLGGQTYTLEGPEGATQADAEAQIRKKYGAPAGAKKEPSMKGELFGGLASGIAKGIGATIGAAGQAEETMQTSGAGFGGQGLQTPTAARSAERAGAFYKPQTGLGEMASSVGETLGNPTSWMGPGGVMAKAGLGALSGIGSYIGGQVGGTPGQIAGGALAPTIPGFAKMGAQRLVRPIRSDRLQDVATLRAEGIEPHAGDVSGRPWVRGLQRADRLTGSYERIAEKPIEQFTSRLAEKIGQTSNRIDADTIEAARRDLGDVFTRAAKALPINFDKSAGDELTKIVQDMAGERVPDSIRNQIEAVIDQIHRGFESKKKGPAKMQGSTYQTMTQKGSFLDRLQSAEDGTTKHYANRVSAALNDALERTARRSKGRKEALAELQDARKKWYNMIVLSEVVSGPGELSASGLIEPARLRTVLAKGQANKLSYAMERGDLHSLARAAEAVMSPYRPQGSMMEQMGHVGMPAGIGGAASHFMGGDPFIGAALGAASPTGFGRLINSDLAQRFIKSGASVPPRGAYELYEQMVKAGRGGLAAGVPGYAEGGIVTQPQLATVGEKGPEVIQPLADMSPAEIAAFRMRQAVKPDTPQGMRSPGGAPSPELQGAMSTAAEVAIPGVGAYRSAREGDYPMAAGQALAAAMPMLGAAMRGAGPAMRYGLPALGAGGATAAVTALSDTAEAGEEGLSPLEKQMLARTPKSGRPALIQKFSEQHATERQREMEAAQKKEADAAKSVEAKAQLEKELEGLPADEQLVYRGMQPDQRAQFWAQKSEAQRQEKAAKEAEEDEKRRSQLPFRERFPGLMKWMPAVAATLSGIIPYGIAARSARKGNRYINEWTQVANDFENAAKAGDLDAMLRTKNILEKYNAEHQKILKGLGKGPGAGTTLAAGTIPFDLEFLTPNAIDAAMLPPGSPGHEQAKQALTDPGEWGGRAITGFAQGMVPALVGGKVGPRLGGVPPTAQSSAAGGTYATMLKQQQAAQRAQKRATAKKKVKKLYEE